MWLQDIRALRAGPERIGSAFSDLLVAETGHGGAALYATSARYGGMGVWELRAGATAQLVDAVAYPETTTLGASGQLTLSADGSTLAYGVFAGHLEGYARHLDGKLADAVSLAGLGLGTDRTVALHWASLAGGEAVYAAGSQGLALFRVIDGGTRLEQVTSGQTGAGAPPLASTVALTEMTVGGTRLLLAADSALEEVRVYRIDTGMGALTLTDTAGAADGLGISDPKALATLAAHGQNWAILGANGTGSISVLRVDANGQLEAVDHVLDTRDTRFGMLQDLVAFTIGTQAFVLAAGADGGASLFALPHDGRLVHLETLEHTLQRPLPDVAALAVGGLADDLSIFAAGDGGLVQIDLPAETVGMAQQAPAGPARIAGGPGGDLLSAAGPGADTLVGWGGNDILVSGPGGGVMEGGEGADVFVFRPAEAPTRITDFTPGEDRLDLKALPMLRSDLQIEFQSRWDGALLRYRGQEITVRSAEGTPLSRQDLFARGVGEIDRVLVLGGLRSADGGTGSGSGGGTQGGNGGGTQGGNGGGTSSGSSGGGTQGGNGGGTSSGSSGNGSPDAAGGSASSGNGGNTSPGDMIRGGDQADAFSGGPRADTLDGGGGADQLWAGDGTDTVFGGPGNDALGGGGGADEVWAGDGNDTVFGGPGDDALGGGGGADGVRGGAGDDTLWGGNGRDTLQGNEGNDRLSGGGGADTFVFRDGWGRDTVTDFDPAEGDLLDLEGWGAVNSFNDLLTNHLPAEGDNALLFAGADSLLLIGIGVDDFGWWREVTGTDIAF
jgi:Ca2+-binding RTX toxin-like protein